MSKTMMDQQRGRSCSLEARERISQVTVDLSVPRILTPGGTVASLT